MVRTTRMWRPKTIPEELADLNRKLDRLLGDEPPSEQSHTAHRLHAIERKLETIMAAIDDLKQAVSDLESSVTSAVTEIETLLGKITAPGASDADIADATNRIKTLTQTIRDEVTKAQGVAP